MGQHSSYVRDRAPSIDGAAARSMALSGLSARCQIVGSAELTIGTCGQDLEPIRAAAHDIGPRPRVIRVGSASVGIKIGESHRAPCSAMIVAPSPKCID